MRRSPNPSRRRVDTSLLVVAISAAVVYFVLAWLSLILGRPEGIVVVWPSSGLLLATLLLLPRQHWPVVTGLIFLANAAANIVAGSDLLISAGFALVNVVEGLLAAVMLHRQSRAPFQLRALSHVLHFVLTVVVATAVAGLVGAGLLALTSGTTFWNTWRAWWVANGLGMVVVGGLLLVWFRGDTIAHWPREQRVEALVLVLTLVVVSLVLFQTPVGNAIRSPYLIFPLLMWAALRFEFRGASAGVALVAVVAVLATVAGATTFAPELSAVDRVLRVQLFLLVMALSTLVLAAVTAERREAQGRLEQTNAALERRVAERTATLTDTNARLQHEVEQRELTAQQAQIAQERLEQVLASVSDQFFALDSDWRYVYVNDQVLVVTGQPRAALLDRSIWELFPDTLGTPFEQELRRAVDTQQPTSFAYYYPGLNRWFENHVYPSAAGLSLLVTDITERKRAESNTGFLLNLDQTFANLGGVDEIEQVAIERLARHLGVTQCTFARIDGTAAIIRHQRLHSGSRFVGEHDLATFFLPEAQEQLRHGMVVVVDDVLRDQRAVRGAEAYRALGIMAFVTVPILQQGRWSGALSVTSDRPRIWHDAEVILLRDIAARVWPRLEQAEALAALQASEARLQELYAQEQVARSQVEEASRLKDEFLATVSHELRTPLTAILGYAQLLQARKRDEAYIIRTVERVVQSAKAQGQLIEDLLDVSRIVSGKLRLEPRAIDLTRVVRAAIDTVRPAVEAKGLVCDVNLDADAGQIIGDSERLQQVVWNLLSNAVKFTPRGGTITVTLRSVGDEAELSVRDTGQGIAPEFLPYVFDQFRQADSTTRRAYSGLGLGLSIVRHIVELHGGVVQARSDGSGEGSAFVVRLPLRQYDGAAQHEPGQEQGVPVCPPELHNLRVLVVDDQPELLELLHELLIPCGVLVQLSASAREALELIQTWRPDVLLSDIAMPGEDGYWLIEQVRRLAPHQGGAIPAAALTAYARMEDRTRVLAAGFQQYLPKPVEQRALFAVLAQLAQTRLD